MGTVIIDKEICIGCGLCVDVCPYNAIQLVENRAVYVLQDCFSCDHCRSVCPVDAVSVAGLVSGMNFSTFTERAEVVQPGAGGMAEIVALMRSRRSCRRYSGKTVSLSLLKDLVKIGTTAPSGTNSQPWRFSILPERQDVLFLGDLTADYYRNLNRQAQNRALRLLMKLFGRDKLGIYYRKYHDSVQESLREWDEEGRDRLFHGATAVILVAAGSDASCPAEDALLATQNMLLAAHAAGLGSCLVGFAVEAMRRNSSIRKKMKIAEDMDVYTVIGLGYPDVKYMRFSGRRSVVPEILRFN
ncbi:MAG: nitroreductase family protein [Deltaproteobacteria bacterium]|nr:nitroreductase family protein [Deltaproteobacteria bacterium]MBW2659943.1 nitroreductase family protein [Deltaproteobacteria bacterium]